MFTWSWGWCAIASWHACGGHRTTLGSQFSPSIVGSRDWTQVVRFCRKDPYPLIHLHGLNYILVKEFRIGGKLMSGCVLLSEGRMHRVSFLLWKPHSTLASLSSTALFWGVTWFCSPTSTQTLVWVLLSILCRLVCLHAFQKTMHTTLFSLPTLHL